jgi:FtsZ-binding cell division protein ZapB
LLKKETELLKSEIERLKEENVSSKKKRFDQESLYSTLKTENKRLKELVELYSDSIKFYQNEIATKIAGRVKPELNGYLNFF